MKVAIIGGGASGLFVAAVISRTTSVTVYERNEKVGKKIYITGKGRCNFTNLCSDEDFFASVVNGAKFLRSSVTAFTPRDAVEYFSSLGLRSKVERGNRVFPVSDKASDVSAALVKAIAEGGGEIILGARVQSVTADDGGFVVRTADESRRFDRVVLATGGMSYPSTGSTGDGYALAASLGHTIVEPRPALCAMKLREDVSALQGLSLKNVSVKIECNGKSFEQFGEMLFTADGASGPCVLTLSSLVTRANGEKKLVIDLKPALTHDELDRRVLRDFEKNANRDFKNSLGELLPRSLIPYIVAESGIDPDKKVNLITKNERRRLVELLKRLVFEVDGLDDMQNAIVTNGGVSLKEIDPKTMESKLRKGLYVVGELLDADALTGGFNLHIAWATGAAAARHITEAANER